MDTVNLEEATSVSNAINEYGHNNPAADLQSLIKYVKSKTKIPEKKILLVLEFLQSINVDLVPITQRPTCRALTIKQEDFNLLDEVNFSYGVARALLERSAQPESGNVDAEEVRKNLKSVTSFLDLCVKLQERVVNIEAMQRFKQAVMDTLEELDPASSQIIVQKLLDADL